MKKTFFFLLILFLAKGITTFAQTNVPGGIVSGTWTLDGSPYNIQGSIQIPNDSALIIQPGVTVNFQGAYKLNVQGQLLAIGTITDTITFTSADTTAGIRGIRFDNTPVTNDTSKIIYCKLQYGTSDYALFFNNFSKAIISKCNISHCSGYNLSGGVGIYCYNSSPIMSYNLISHNSSTGIWGDWGCNSIITYNNISNNSGSGIRCAHSNAIISNNIISNNSGGEGGGICCNDYSIPTITNNIIINNSATYGGGICFHNTNSNMNPNLYNTIIWGNTASSGGSQVFLGDEENDPNFYYCDVQGGSAAFDVNGNTYTGTYQNNLNADPLVVTPSGGSGTGYNGVIADWSLQNISPCIDAGKPFDTVQLFKYPATDIAGNIRVTVCRIDIGAYEYQTGIPLAISLSISQPILCNGSATGEIVAVASGGTSPYTYLWSNGQTTFNVTGLVAGNYTVTVSTASYGCTLTKSITITQPTAIAIDAGTDTSIICDGTVQLDAQPKWVTLNNGVTAPLYSVFFTDSDTGYAVGGSGGGEAAIILKTTNGGSNWTSQTNPSNFRLYSVYFTNTNTGYAVGDQGIILKTIDGGTNWAYVQTIGSINFLSSIYFINNDTGYACGQGVSTSAEIILKTIDGGTNWTTQTSGNNISLNSIYFLDANTGYAVGDMGIILKTINGGINWTTQTSGNNNNLKSVYFTDTNTGYAVGMFGTILKTSNGGTNWTVLTSGTTYDLNSVYFPNTNTGYAVGGNETILKTINNGTNWTALTSVTTYDLNSVYFPNTNTGYAVGNNGTILKLYVLSNYTGNDTLTYEWSPSTGLNYDTIPNPTATATSNTTYYVTVTTSNGCTAIDSVTVNVDPLTINGTNASTICGDSTTLNTTTNYTGTGTLTYSWVPVTGLNNSSIANPVATIDSNQTYTVTVTTPNGCVATDDVYVTLIPMNAPEICIVGVDSTNKNMVVWNKPFSLAIDSFHIYRETNITDVYERIGVVPYDSMSIFVDALSQPDVQSNKYKISILDDCGIESAQSDFHKTMHLSINQGIGNTWNLIWEPYEGFTVSTYNIYRGTDADNMVLIGSSPGGNTQYSDVSAPSGYVYYQVEVMSPNLCDPSKSYNSSLSNIATNNPNAINDSYANETNIYIYPNPASDAITLNINNANNGDWILNIYNVMSLLIKTEVLKPNQHELDISNLYNGIYILEIISNNFTVRQKLIIQR
jgi:photosystem II stability/assembly factor-like uncharacterized protein